MNQYSGLWRAAISPMWEKQTFKESKCHQNNTQGSISLSLQSACLGSTKPRVQSPAWCNPSTRKVEAENRKFKVALKYFEASYGCMKPHGGCKDSSAVRRIGCSYRSHGFGSQHPRDGSKPPVAPGLGYPVPSFDFCRLLNNHGNTHTCMYSYITMHIK